VDASSFADLGGFCPDEFFRPYLLAEFADYVPCFLVGFVTLEADLRVNRLLDLFGWDHIRESKSKT